MKQKQVGTIVMLAGMAGAAGALDTGYGWCTSGVLSGIGAVLLLSDIIKRKGQKREKENDRIAAQYIVTFYKGDKPGGRSRDEFVR